MTVVVLTGPESAGKSSLSLALAERFGAPVVREYVREYIDAHGGRDTCYTDVQLIAREQWRREHAARSGHTGLLLLDTHLLSNHLWSLTLFGRAPGWIEQTLARQRYDAIFLLEPEGLPWQADGMRCQPDLAQRQLFHAQLGQWLQRHNQQFIAIGGNWQQRLARITAVIEDLHAT